MSVSCSASAGECDQRESWWPPRRASEMASAVPQAPAPRMAMRLMLRAFPAGGGLPKRLSVPARRRRMLAWCLTMTSSGMKRKPTMTIGRALGDEVEAEERERCGADDGGERDVAGEREDDDEDEQDAEGATARLRARKTPSAVATPLPPRKPSQTGKTWPRTAATAAATARS